MIRTLPRPPRLPNAREAATATAAALALAAVLALFVKVADLLAERHAGLIDHTVLGEAVEHRSLPMTVFMEGVSTAAEIPLMATAGLLALFFARTLRSWRPLVVVGGAAVLSVGLATLVKDVAARTRPPLATAVVAETGFSFPSRHTTVATALLLAMAYLLARRTRSRALTVTWWAGAVALSGLVASSRVYLGVHWATDVTAGFALGAAAALTLITADLGHRMWTRRHHPGGANGS
ncbi:phosphatase PAP2 family protein [Streptomyces sp. NRRL F-2580]|uniref:phosphatase PAP2 family protein n=1 Tax=Streptomyces sp. NRRL F-2580 TaxID=1463841 RepID=UPI0006892E85|nr:phosphatase PAP2 family protein [Streptomyces sp. NRRL F-2580]